MTDMETSVQSKETVLQPCDILKQDWRKLTQDVYLADLDKNVVDFMPNFDETEKKEPAVLPVSVSRIFW